MRRYLDFALACLATCLLTTDGAAQQRLPGSATITAPIEQIVEGVQVRVDPRIEMMGVLQLVTGYPLRPGAESAYVMDARSFFRGVEVPASFVTFVRGGLLLDAVPATFASLGPLPFLDAVEELPPRVVEWTGGREEVRTLGRELAAFAEESDFPHFYRAHAGSLEQIIERHSAPVAAAVRQLEEYLGVRLGRVRVTLSPLLHDGGFAMEGDEETAARAFIGPVGLSGGLPDFGGEDRLGPLVWHEFAHTVVNPLTDAHPTRVEELAGALEPIRERMAEQAYETWPTVVNEHIIRAIQVRMTARLLGEERGRRAMRAEVERGFRYVPALTELLRHFETDRDTHPTIESFYPSLLDVFGGRGR